MNGTDSFHTPVMSTEVMEWLRIDTGKRYIDATLGGGGHALEMVKRGAVVLGIDRDVDAIRYVKERLSKDSSVREENAGSRLTIKKGNFSQIEHIAQQNGFSKVNGILFDLGVSSYQLSSSGRGFSFKGSEPLDMRMDSQSEITAADIINTFNEEELYEVFSEFSEELDSRAIARAVFRARTLKGSLTRTEQLTDILNQFSQSGHSMYARIFQSLRIAVNSELKNLNSAMSACSSLLLPEGRFVVISYHSLEDRAVKLFIRRNSESFENLTRHPVIAGINERRENSRAKPAKLRVAQKK